MTSGPHPLPPLARVKGALTCVGVLGLVVWMGATRATAIAQSGSPVINLSAAEVTDLLASAAQSLADGTLATAVADRKGRILGVYARPGAAANTADVAVSLARTGAFFSHDEAPLGSRTVRFISGIHFPPGVPNTPNAALYGIENTNRGCQLTPDDQVPLERPRAIAGSALPGSPLAACRASDTSGCARGGPIVMPDRSANFNVGISTGKGDYLDSGQPLNVPVNPGGVPIYRNGRLVGGLGVAGVASDRAEYAAFAGILGAGARMGVLPVPANPLPTPGAVFIDGLRLPFYGTCTSVQCVIDSVARRPPGTSAGSFTTVDLIVAPRDGQTAPDGDLFARRGSVTGAGLTLEDVNKILTQAIARATVTRAQIRLPAGRFTRMIIAITDQAGNPLGAYRMPDATVFSFDVAVTKARNAYYFSTSEGYRVLRNYVDRNPYDKYQWTPDPPGGAWAVTARTLNFGGQPLFPPGINLTKAGTPGPWFDLYSYDLQNPCTEGPGVSRGGNPSYLNQSGIVWFAGSAPLYKDGVLVGGVGVSGDGVEQDDYVTAGAVAGFEPPAELRVDRSVIRTGAGATVRLPYFKFPRDPEIR